MTRRMRIGLMGALAGGALAGATALAFGGHADRHGMMRRFAEAVIDDALDQAKATPEQRAAIEGARDRVFAVIEEQGKGRQALVEESLELFEADRVDRPRLEALHRQHEESRQKVAEAVHQALLEAHDVLGPEQRKAVADYIRSRGHRRRE